MNDQDQQNSDDIYTDDDQLEHQEEQRANANEVTAGAVGQPIDIFAWANNLFMYKDQLQFDLFLMSKNNAVYSVAVDGALARELHALFLDKMVEYVTTGAGEGMVVRSFEAAESEDNVLQYTKVQHVDKLVEAMAWIIDRPNEMEQFSEEEHDLKRMRGIILRGSHPEMSPFYIIKALSPSLVAKGVGAWMIGDSAFEALESGATLRVPADNQLLIVGEDLFVFNQGKLERLFGYNAKKNAIAEKKVAQIEQRFKLSFAGELDMQTLVKNSKPTINKLQKLDPESVTQEQLVDHAEELGITIMTDDNGAILIADEKDLTTFVNLLNDDYIESQLTGLRYEIRSKRILKPSEE